MLQVQEAIYRNLKGHTVLLIAHRLSTVEKADRIVVINKGQVVQQGSHSQLLNQDGLYKNLVHRQLLASETNPSSEQQHSPGVRFESPTRHVISPISESYQSASSLSITPPPSRV